MKILFGKKGALQTPQGGYVFFDETSVICKPLSKQSKAANIFVNVTIVLHYLFSIGLLYLFADLQPETLWLAYVENVPVRLLLLFVFILLVFIAHIALYVISSPLLETKSCTLIIFPHGFSWKSIHTTFRCYHDYEAPAPKQKHLLYHALPFLLFTVLPALYMIVFQRFSLFGFLFFMFTPPVLHLETIFNVLRAPKESIMVSRQYFTPTEPQKTISLRIVNVKNKHMEVRDYLALNGKISQIIPDRTNETLEKDTQNIAEKHNLTDIRYIT